MERIKMTPAAPYLGIGNQLAINVDHVVWLRAEDDGSLTVWLAAPGPDGKNEVKVPAGASANALVEHVGTRRKAR